MQIVFGSVCSGIESASVAWEPIGFSACWFSEIEGFPSAVLAHHWPHIPNLGDLRALPGLIRAGCAPAPLVLVGGTPCQAFSVAGQRGGINDPRGQLTITYVDVLDAIDEQRGPGDEAVCVWENVPGVLSSRDNAFGCFLGALVGSGCELQPAGPKWGNAGCVFGPKRVAAWRVLDAQYFGVAQRRRRVFVVASARDGFDPRAVLFESEGVRRDTPPSREAGGNATAATGVSADVASAERAVGVQEPPSGHLITVFNKQRQGQYSTEDIASTCAARDYKDATDLVCVHGTQDPCVSDKAFALGCNSGRENAVVYPTYDKATRHAGANGKGSGNGLGAGVAGDPAPTLTAGDKHAVAFAKNGMTVRRLTPTECERLQGFPDNHTRIPWRNTSPEGCPDGPRYIALGNSKAVPVVRWVGGRIKQEIERCK